MHGVSPGKHKTENANKNEVYRSHSVDGKHIMNANKIRADHKHEEVKQAINASAANYLKNYKAGSVLSNLISNQEQLMGKY